MVQIMRIRSTLYQNQRMFLFKFLLNIKFWKYFQTGSFFIRLVQAVSHISLSMIKSFTNYCERKSYVYSKLFPLSNVHKVFYLFAVFIAVTCSHSCQRLKSNQWKCYWHLEKELINNTFEVKIQFLLVCFSPHRSDKYVVAAVKNIIVAFIL